MIWKAIFVVMLAIGALAEFPLLQNCQNLANTSYVTYQSCIKNYTDLDILQSDMKEAQDTGSYEVLFRKYCPKLPQLTSCANDALSAHEACDSAADLNFYLHFFAVRDEITEFLCFNDAERVQKFVSEQGVSCIQQKSKAIYECTRKTSNEISNDSVQENCKLMDELRSCLVSALEECTTRAAVNMTESLFPFAKKAFNCTN